MPAPNSKTEAIERIRLLLAALTSDWQDRDAIIECVGVYPPALMSARAMFRADMRALLALGFQVERTDGHHDPQWRVVGHERFGREVPVKFCPRCKQWRRVQDEFTKDSDRPSRKAIYCRYCNYDLNDAWRREDPSRAYAQAKRWRTKFPERARTQQQRAYRRRKARKNKEESDATFPQNE